MKKILIAVAFLACWAGNVMADDLVTAKVSGTTLNIGLVNETTYCAFQMDITLPEGTTASAVEAVADRLSQEGSDTEIGGTKFIVSYNDVSESDATEKTYRVVAYNLSNSMIDGTSGSNILKITLSGAVSDPTGIKVSEITFVGKDDLTGYKLPDATGENGVVVGDVNKDGKVSVADISALLNIINNKAESFDYDYEAADANNDGKYSVADISILIYIINNNK